MDEERANEMVDAIETAGICTGRKLDFDTIVDVLMYSVRKLEVIGRGVDYLPLLFENELRDYAMREEINMIGALVASATA